MTYHLLASMPAFVCGTLTMVLLFDLIQWPQRSRCIMTIFMAVATLLYMGHFVYFTHETQLLPITDTIYCTCNPLVFPLYYVYIKSLTERHLLRWHVAI
ncbi:MAG: AraC family transcriptional regulator, partial [Prevotella sp.]|nr:AraC family transcriptional regulator [Prevotella sp.]